MLDGALASLYGVTTKAFNQAVKRHRERFPSDFMFQLTIEETQVLPEYQVQALCLYRARDINVVERLEKRTGHSGKH